MEQNLDLSPKTKVLITGGGGYLGSKLAERLVHQIADIYLLDIQFNETSKRLITDYINIHKVELSLANKEALKQFCLNVKPEYIFHFGALLTRKRDFGLFEQLYDVNVSGTYNLLEALMGNNYKNFVFSSSSEVYGTKNKSPFHEEQIPLPVSPYSLSKLMAEDLIKTYSELHDKPYTILRIFNFFGEDMPESFFLNQLISTLKKDEIFEMTGGEQKRDFLYIEDVLTAMITLCNSEISKGETINICSGKGVILKILAQEIAVKLKKEHLLKIGALPYRDNEVWEMIGNNEKLKSLNVIFRSPSFKERINSIIQI